MGGPELSGASAMGKFASMKETVIQLSPANQGVVLRLAGPEDVEALLDVGEEVFGEGHPSLTLGFDRTKSQKYLNWLLSRDTTFCLVAEKDGLVIGGLSGILLPDFFTSDVAGTEIFFGIRKGYRSIALAHDMVRVFTRLCLEMGATSVRFTPSTAPKWLRYRRFLGKMGFEERSVTMEYRPASGRN